MAHSKDISYIACEFLEVAIQLILYVRDVYPAEVFERRRYCGVSVQWARHPGLRDYIHTTVRSLESLIQQGTVEKIVLVVYDGQRCPLEHFVFSVGVDLTYNAAELPQVELEHALRAFLVKISVSNATLGSPPTDSTWELLAYSKELPTSTSEAGKLWIAAEGGQLATNRSIIPVKSLAKGPLQLQLHVEQPSKGSEDA